MIEFNVCKYRNELDFSLKKHSKIQIVTIGNQRKKKPLSLSLNMT
jgi:hypothetical protein